MKGKQKETVAVLYYTRSPCSPPLIRPVAINLLLEKRDEIEIRHAVDHGNLQQFLLKFCTEAASDQRRHQRSRLGSNMFVSGKLDTLYNSINKLNAETRGPANRIMLASLHSESIGRDCGETSGKREASEKK